MSKFVGKNGDNFLLGALLNEGIVNDDVLLPGETKEIGIAVSAALASINYMQLVKWELELLGQILDVGLQLSFLQG
jgi:hypothetical protein